MQMFALVHNLICGMFGCSRVFSLNKFKDNINVKSNLSCHFCQDHYRHSLDWRYGAATKQQHDRMEI